MLLRPESRTVSERELLIQRICDWTRQYDRAFRPDDEFRLRLRLRTESLEMLRRRFEVDCTDERGEKLAQAIAAPKPLFNQQPIGG